MSGSPGSALPTVTAVLKEHSASVTAFEATQHCSAVTQDALEEQVMGLLMAAAEYAGGEVHVRMVDRTGTPEPPREFVLTTAGETRPVPPAPAPVEPTPPAPGPSAWTRNGPPVPKPAYFDDNLVQRLGAPTAPANGAGPASPADDEEPEGKTRIRSHTPLPMPTTPPPGVTAYPPPPVQPQQSAVPVPAAPAPADVSPADAAPNSATASFLTLHRAREIAEQGLRGWLNRVFRMKLAPTGREREERICIDAVRQPWARPRTIVVLNPKGGAGKALAVDEPVLTPTGWRPIGDLAIGDLVVGRDGLSHEVLGVFPQGERDLYDVTLTDGTVIRADADHLWEVETTNERGSRGDKTCSQPDCAREVCARELCSAHYGQWWRGVPFGPVRQGRYTRVERTDSGRRLMTTAQILAAGPVRTRPGHGDRHYFFIPTCDPIKFDPVDLPIDPYLLGLLLGDGSLSDTTIAFTTADQEIADEVQARLPEGCWLRYKDRYDYRVVRLPGTPKVNPLKDALRDLGLHGTTSESKFIPPLYQLADLDARVALLQGLLDTDGYVVRRHGTAGIAAGFCTVSDRLATDVKFLAESLGCVVTHRTYSTTYEYLGREQEGKPAHNLRIVPPTGLNLFRLARKADRMGQRTVQPLRGIHSIEPAGRGQAVCIAVAAPDHLFLTRSCVPTHNTPITILLSAVFGTYGDGSVLAWDNNDTRGTLGWRTEQARGHSAHVRDLLPHTGRLMAAQAQAGDLQSFTHRQREDRYDVLRSTPHQLPNQGRLTAEDFDAVHLVACKYYRVIFVDTGNDETAPHWLRAIDRADQIVVATTTRSDRAEAARLMLNSLRERNQRSAALANNAVVVVSKAARDEPDPAVIARRFAEQTRAAVPVPFDAAIGADWLRLKGLRRDTRMAVLRAARAVAEGL